MINCVQMASSVGILFFVFRRELLRETRRTDILQHLASRVSLRVELTRYDSALWQCLGHDTGISNATVQSNDRTEVKHNVSGHLFVVTQDFIEQKN